MRNDLKSRFAALLLAGLIPLSACNAASADDSQPVRTVWKPVSIRYSYVGFTAAYSCDAAASRVKNILLALGAHPQTKVQATGCYSNRPSRNFFISITTATPVAVDARSAAHGKVDDKTIEALGLKGDFATAAFASQWRTVDLGRDPKLDLKAGDCELMQGLRDNVLPKLSVKIVDDRVQCIPHQMSLATPVLTVSTLAPMPSADEGKSPA